MSLHNLGPYKGTHTFSFSTNSYLPVTLIGGMNGGGKTTIINSIMLLLYGKRSQMLQDNRMSYTKYLKSFVHNNHSEHEKTWIQLRMSVKDDLKDTELTIHRTWKVISNQHEEKLQVWKDGEEDNYLASNWDTYVEELIPIGVSGLFFFDGEKIGRIANEDETGKSLRDAIYSMLGINLIDRLIADLHRTVMDSKWKLSSRQVSAELGELSGGLKHCMVEKDKLILKKGDLENRIAFKKNELQKTESQYVADGGAFLENRGYLEKERELIKSRIAEVTGILHSIAGGALPLIMLKPIISRCQEGFQKAVAINEASLLLPRLTKRDNDLLLQLTELGVEKRVLEQIADKMESDRKKLQHLTQNNEVIPYIPGAGEQIRYLMEYKFGDICQNANNLILEHSQLSANLDKIERQLHYELDEKMMTYLLKKMSNLSKDIAVLEKEKDDVQDRIKEAEIKQSILEQKYRYILRQMALDKINNNEVNRVIEYALNSEDVMKTFKERLLFRKIDLLENNINKAFKLLIEKESLISRIKIERPSLKITFIDPMGHEFPKRQLSEGEKQMFAIAFLWGLALSSGRSLPVIIDTPMARLDSSHRMNFVRNYIPKSSHQVIVLSTDEEINGPYLQSLEKYVGKKLLLMFNEQTKSSIINEGYFA